MRFQVGSGIQKVLKAANEEFSCCELHFCCMRNFLASKLRRPVMKHFHETGDGRDSVDENIIANPNFDDGLQGWSTSYSCTCSICDSTSLQGIHPQNGKHYIAVSKRTQGWQGIEQNITSRLLPKVKYEVVATVSIAGPPCSEADAVATVRLENTGSETKYLRLGSVKASKDGWRKLQGTLLLEELPERVIFYLEGPPSGIDILVDSVCIKPIQSSSAQVAQQQQEPRTVSEAQDGEVLQNPRFTDRLQGWSGRCCSLLLEEAANIPQVYPCSGKHFAVAAKRSEKWHGVEQDVTGRLRINTMYDVHATIRVHGTSSAVEILATLYIRKANMQEQYMTIGRTKASSKDWTSLRGSFTLHSVPKTARIFLEGPAAGIDILVDSFSVCPAKKPKPSPPPKFEDPKFGTNIVENCNFCRGLSCWHSMGSCTLLVAAGAPKIFPPSAKESLQYHRDFTGNYIVATNRKFTWEGPAQTLTERIQLFLSYQVSAWVRVGEGGHGIQKVNVALSVDGEWMTGGEVEACAGSWKEIAGSFRLEKKLSEVLVYVQGPDPGVDLMVANLQIYSVNRNKRFASLTMQAEQVRKRDVVLQFRHPRKLSSAMTIRVQQTKASFPIGACINRNNLENSAYVDFFLKHFNFTVFENELKWGWTEPSQGSFNYKDADELCKFCLDHQVPVRGHCVFWEVEHCVQDWVKKLSREELEAAVQNRISGLTSRFKGKFQHYDVNNEMLHGEFYKSRLGPNILAYMFQLIHQFDPSARLFVNDYHVEDGRDANSSPENYIRHIQTLQSQGAPVGGIGVQGHVDNPIGGILCQAFDKLAMLGLPIWLTEVDVSSSNEHVRADDLEVVLREAFAHPAIEGVILWGFWQGCSREDGHLVDVDSEVNEAGKRLIALKQEWQTALSGCADGEGKLEFRGYYGSYSVTIDMGNGKQVKRSFEVTRGEGPLRIELSI